MEHEMIADFPWGLLLVTDREAKDEIPTWESDDQIVTASETALVVRIRHEQEGDVIVRVRESLDEVIGEGVFDGSLRITSGVLRVSDALGKHAIDMTLEPGLHRVRAFVTPVHEAEEVELLIDP